MHPPDSYTDLQLGVVSKNTLILSLTNNSGSLCNWRQSCRSQVCLCLQPQDPRQPQPEVTWPRPQPRLTDSDWLPSWLEQARRVTRFNHLSVRIKQLELKWHKSFRGGSMSSNLGKHNHVPQKMLECYFVLMSRERKLKQVKQQDRCDVFYKVMMLYHLDYCLHVKKEKNFIHNISTLANSRHKIVQGLL